MKVQLIASTVLEDPYWAGTGYTDSGTPSSADELAEFAGRNCYRSFSRPNPGTRENVDYLKHILDVGHESVLEHASATFYIEASRSVLTELERHRHLSFSVVSQRYVDPTELGVHEPPAVKDLIDAPGRGYFRAKELLEEIQHASAEAYDELVTIYAEAGLGRKKAREAARAVLPNMTNSPMVVTGNHRAWRYVIKARWHEAADAEIRSLAGELLRQLREIAPHTYQDIPDTPYSY
ncbi:ThyX-like thymidylate synthase [Mycobacterium phage BuzzBuzz]|uniref:ThyX-like thymidylate synthase n=9 Tax=Mycobacterium phage Bxz2 TaxID=205870 RepID=A0A0A7RT66_BPMB2|nr:thymidylate synthase [Mycobacterium phage Bxz2]AIM51192.1 ThyX-like thymidylate synthase [Mycobacterium phage Farber]AJA41835.1 ThyX-like thymidylate synthase [Mycobacterium phage Spike509]AJA41926.1 ThyX-like thymidylate synthase [Mycobacterium phage Phoxy]ANU79385.1 ThyX-like thymidylate synthase [Mycobacterium phage BuzzBuzz]AOZ64823.1 ThyX-like thymidylate synthase [Mycobacterium phage Louie6]ASM62469.1 ThyX-like thymidylate synthase [Mycobacterium phage KADY]AXH47946.1 ThyX-like thym